MVFPIAILASSLESFRGDQTSFFAVILTGTVISSLFLKGLKNNQKAVSSCGSILFIMTAGKFTCYYLMVCACKLMTFYFCMSNYCPSTNAFKES